MRIKLIILAAMLLLGTSLVPRTTALAQTDPHQAHYIVFTQHADGTLETVYHTYVTLDTPLISMAASDLAALAERPNRESMAVRVALTSQKNGRILYQSAVDVPRWLRGEFHTDEVTQEGESNIDAHLFPLENPTFVVRVPVIPDTRLTLNTIGSAGNLPAIEQSLSLDEIAAAAPPSQMPTPEVVYEDGPSTNRVDLLIIGDGYTSGQQSLFNTHAADIADEFFAVSPYTEYRPFFNVQTLFVASTQSGADHPSCSDPFEVPDPLEGTLVNTAFDARFCTNNIQRLLTVSSSKIYTAAASVPNWDHILVIVNDTMYGGAGGSFATSSMNGSAYLIMQHEFGHSFIRLADEYTSPYPGFPACSDLDSGSPCEANVTNQTTRALIKWNEWILGSTPIPTPETWDYEFLTGLFLGARYQTSGMYRQGLDCIMRSLGAPFCNVDGEAFVLRLYNGQWGTPWEGIDNLEPGTENPSNASTVTTPQSGRLFKVNVLAPLNSNVQYGWYLDGNPLVGGTTTTAASINFAGSTTMLGAHQLTVVAVDNSAWIHTSNRASVVTTRTWNLNVSPYIFLDVPTGHWAESYITAFYNLGLTGGCGNGNYCPNENVTRAEMAVFILRAKHYPSLPHTPPDQGGTFSDVPVATKEWMEDWIEEFYDLGITTGCAVGPLRYCPENTVTRAEMAVFILRAIEGSGYAPPAASDYFSDVPVGGKEWMMPWIDEFYRRGFTVGCAQSPLQYCPEQPVTRAEMAVFILRAFDNLPYP